MTRIRKNLLKLRVLVKEFLVNNNFVLQRWFHLIKGLIIRFQFGKIQLLLTPQNQFKFQLHQQPYKTQW